VTRRAKLENVFQFSVAPIALVHRDIKPSNIMVSLEEGDAVTAKIIDLGLAKAVNEAGSQTANSMPGGFAGTPEFASDLHLKRLDPNDRRRIYLRWHNRTGCCFFQ
jgi:serine/threonine protein kinase